MSLPARARTTRPRNRHPSPGDVEALRSSINSHTGGLHSSINSYSGPNVPAGVPVGGPVPVDDGDGDDGEERFDLARNYQNAIDCLVQCDAVIRSLEGRLAARERELDARDAELDSKDEALAAKDEEIRALEERIARTTSLPDRREELDAARDAELAAKDREIELLEEKIVRMSLELASSKAFEDAHRSTRRKKSVAEFDDEDEDEGSDDELYPAPLPSVRAPLDISVVKKGATTKADRRRHSTSVLSSDSVTTATTFSRMSVASFNGSNGSLGQFFRGSQLFRGGRRVGNREASSPKEGGFDAEGFDETAGGTRTVGTQTEGGDATSDGRGGTTNGGGGRRPGRSRTEAARSSLNRSLTRFLEAGTVVFPSSFEEVLTKGCLDVRDSLKKLSGGDDVNWAKMLREVE